ncbi:MAG: S9 family peptidase [Deltaproteobacteria bacterium]|nr:S9 family peptidase [Deltaproteobacteria bacterium]
MEFYRTLRLTGLLLALVYPLSVLTVQGGTEKPERIPVYNLMQDPLVSGVEISPDGKTIAALFNKNDRIMVLVKDLELADSEPVIINVLNHNVKWIKWANDRRIIAGAIVEEGIWQDYYALVVMDKDGKNMRHLISDYSIGNLIDLLPDDPDYVLVEELNIDNQVFPEVYKVCVGNENRKWRILESRFNIDHWITDGNDDVRMGVGYLSDRMVIDAKMPDGSWKTIDENRYLKDPQYYPLAVGKNGVAYVLSYHETDKAALYEYYIETQKFGRQLFKHDAVDIEDIYYSRQADAVEYAVFTIDTPELHFFDEQLGRDYQSVSRALTDTTNLIVSRSADEKRMIILAGSSGDPGRYYLFDRENKTLKYLGSCYPDLEKMPLSKTEGMKYKARDGMTIYGYVSFPSAHSGSPLPMVVLVHGGPYARDKNEFNPWVQFLTNRGYIVFQPNFRGSTGYGDSYWKSGYRQWGLAMQNDILDGVKILIDNKTADEKRICVMGASYGGYAALMGAAKNSDIFRCAISIAGISDLNKLMIQKGNYLNRALIGDDPVERRAGSPINYAPDIECPVLLAHGTDDNTVYYSQSDDMHDALKRADKDVTFLKLKDETHHLEDIKNRVSLFETIEKFLNKHMGASSGEK